MDKMTINMIAGAVLSSLLVIFGTNTLIDIVYPRGGAPEAPVEKAEAPAAGEAATAEASQPLPVLLAAGKVDAGAAQAKKCGACHSFEEGGPNKVGPDLHGVVGRPVASHPGFAYSEALKKFGGNWDYEKLNCFIRDPKGCVAGTKMTFAGLKKDSDRADVIAYLRSVTPNAPPLPAVQEAATAPAANPPAAAPPAATPPAATPPATNPPAAAPAPAAAPKPAPGAPPAPAAASAPVATPPAATQDGGAAAGSGPANGGGSGPGQTNGEVPAHAPQARPDAPGATQ